MTAAQALRNLLDAIDREQMGSDGGPYLKLSRIDRELHAARRAVEERCPESVDA